MNKLLLAFSAFASVQAKYKGPAKMVANGDDCIQDSICADIDSCCGPAEFDGD